MRRSQNGALVHFQKSNIFIDASFLIYFVFIINGAVVATIRQFLLSIFIKVLFKQIKNLFLIVQWKKSKNREIKITQRQQTKIHLDDTKFN